MAVIAMPAGLGPDNVTLMVTAPFMTAKVGNAAMDVAVVRT